MMTPNGEPTTDLAEKVRALPGLLVYPGKIDGDHISRSAVLALAEARATATPGRIGDLVIAAERARLRKFREARATATPGLDVDDDDVMEGFRARHPNVSVFATATPGLDVERVVRDWLGPCCTHPTPGCVVCGFAPFLDGSGETE